MKLLFSRRFTKEYKRLPKHIQVAVDKQLRLLVSQPEHPSQDLKKMQGTREIRRGKITAGYRFTFEIEGDTYFLRRVGPHDIERKP